MLLSVGVVRNAPPWYQLLIGSGRCQVASGGDKASPELRTNLIHTESARTLTDFTTRPHTSEHIILLHKVVVEPSADVANHQRGNHQRVQSVHNVEDPGKFRIPRRQTRVVDDAESDKPQDDKRKSQSTLLVELAETAELWHTEGRKLPQIHT